MQRVLKIAGIVAAVLVGLLVLGVVVINLIPGETYKSLISSGVKSATGRELVIQGDLDIKLLTTFALKASDIKFANADWGSRPHMASVDNIDAEIALFPLLKGVLDIALVIDNPDIHLETHSSGQGNWEFGELATEAGDVVTEDEEAAQEIEATESSGLPIRPLIRKLHINGTRFAFLDGKSGDEINVQSEKLHIGSADDELSIELKGMYNDIPLAFTGGFDNAEFFIDNQPANVKLDGHFGDAKLVVQGTAGPLAPTFDLAVTVGLNADSVAAFTPLAGRDLPDIGPLSISAKLTGKDGKYAVSDMVTSLADKTLMAEAKGSIADLIDLNGLKLEAKVDTGNLTQVLEAVGFKSKYPLPDSLNAAVMAEGNLKKLTIKQFQTKIEGQGVNLNATAEVKNIMTLAGISAGFSLETDSLDIVEEITKTELPPFGPLKATANIVSKGENPGLMEIKAALNGEIIRADVAGSIGDPLNLKDVNVNVNLSMDSLAWLADFIKMELPPLGSFKASANIASQGESFEANDIKANLDGENITVRVAGSVGDLLKAQGIDATVDLGVQSLAFVSDYVKIDLPSLGPLKVSAGIASKGESFEAKDIKVDLTGDKIQAKVAGSVGDLLKAKEIDANVNLGIESLTVLSKIAKTDLPPLGPLSVSANIVSKGENLGLMEIEAALNGEIIHADVAGSIGDPLNLKDINANVNLGVDSLAWLADFIKMELPPLGSFKASANIASQGKTFEIKDIQANLEGENITAKVAGSVGDLLKVQGINATVDLGVQSLAFVSDYVKIKLPPLGPLRASAGISSKGDTLAAKNIKVDLAGDKIHAKVAGSIGDLLKLKAINADVNLGVESLSILSDIAKTDLPPLGPLSASAVIASKGETFEVKEVNVDLTDEHLKAKVTASVADVLKLAGINADINVSVDSLASLNSLVKQELPASAPVSVQGKISSEGGLDAPASIDTVVKTDGVTANLKGSIVEPLAAKGIDLALVVEAESMQKVGKLAGTEFKGTEPVKLVSKFNTGENSYELSELHLQSGPLDVKGKAAFTQPSEAGGRPRLSGEFHVGDLDISKRQAAKIQEAGAEIKDEPDTEEEVEAEKKDKVFSSEPLPFGPLKAVDVDFELTVESLTTQELNLENLAAKLTLDKGFLSLEPLNAGIGDGTLGGTAVLDARNSPAALKADIEMKDATFRNFGGKIHFLVDLEGSGDSIAAIMASLDGQVLFDVKEATLKKSLMTGFGTGILDTLNPFDKEKEDTELICAIILFDIEDGIADANKTIAAQMTDVTWFGSGEINLMTEEIGFGMNPKPRKGLGISLGSLAKMVAFGGTLAHPKIVLDPKDIAVKYGKYTAAMATGGLTLAADLLFSKIKANTDVCANILEELDKLQEADEKAEKGKLE